jgi:hypothetical protein
VILLHLAWASVCRMQIVAELKASADDCLRFAGTYTAPAPTGPATVAGGGRMGQQSPSSQMQPMVQQTSMQQSLPPGMSAVQLAAQQVQAPSQTYQQQPPTLSHYAQPQQVASQQTRQQLIATPVETMSTAPTQAQTAPGMQPMSFGGQQPTSAGSPQMSVAPQYIQMADGTIRQMVPVQGDVPRGAQLESVPLEPQKTTALQTAPMQANAAVYTSTMSAAPPEYSTQYSTVREPSVEYQQLTPPDLRPSVLPDPVTTLDTVVSGRDMPLESVPVTDQGPVLPVDATETLYVEDVPTDMSKRELSHIFRPFGGFKVSGCHAILHHYVQWLLWLWSSNAGAQPELQHCLTTTMHTLCYTIGFDQHVSEQATDYALVPSGGADCEQD